MTNDYYKRHKHYLEWYGFGNYLIKGIDWGGLMEYFWEGIKGLKNVLALITFPIWIIPLAIYGFFSERNNFIDAIMIEEEILNERSSER